MFREDDFEAYYAKIGADADVMRSIRVAERIGETLEGRVDLFGHETLVYGIRRAPYR